MSIVLGIDVGGSTTKIIGLAEDRQLIGTLQVKANDQLTSLYGAIGSFLYQNELSLGDVHQVALTGVGASYIHSDIYDIPTKRIEEFIAIGTGGKIMSGKEQLLVVSLGTGSAFVSVNRDEISHIGGSGVGGGTILGLARSLLDLDDIGTISNLASIGKRQNVDVSIQDLCKTKITTLPSDATAANLAKLKKTSNENDVCLGLMNMVYEVIGTMAAFASTSAPTRDVLLTGSLANLAQAKQIFAGLGDLYKLNFIIPKAAIFSTAIGAAANLIKK